MDRQTQELIRQHTFACFTMANLAMHVAHVEFHHVQLENSVISTPEGDAAIRAARNRLKLAMTIKEQAQEACSSRDNIPPHPFFTEGFWK